MKKRNIIVKFVKKYKKYLLIGAGIGLVCALIWWGWSEVNRKIPTNASVTSIPNPFATSLSTPSFTNIQNINIPDNVVIYKVKSIANTEVYNFINNFDQNNPEGNSDNSVLNWTWKDGQASYLSNTLMLYVSSDKGLQLDTAISSATDVKNFFYSNFKIENTTVDDTDSSNEKTVYKGYISLNDISYGSLVLNGYAYNLTVQGNKLYSLSLLVLSEESIMAYQKMSLTAVSKVLQIENLPMSVTYLSEDENYKKAYPLLIASAKLKKVNVKSEKLLYIFSDLSYGYIVPVYSLEGDGSVVDSQGNTYWVDASIFVCAIDPSYLLENTTYSNEEGIIDPAQ